MSQSDIIITPEVAKLVDERKRTRLASEESRRQATTLEQLSSQIAEKGSAQPLSPFTSEATPPLELAAVVPKLQQELSHITQIQSSIAQQRTAIEEIKRKAQNLMLALIACGVVVFVILLLLLLHAAHVF